MEIVRANSENSIKVLYLRSNKERYGVRIIVLHILDRPCDAWLFGGEP